MFSAFVVDLREPDGANAPLDELCGRFSMAHTRREVRNRSQLP